MILDMVRVGLGRHKLRTALTITGVIIGILLITTMASFSEGISVTINEEMNFISGFVTVVQEGTTFATVMNSEVDEELVKDIEEIDGVEKAVPIVFSTVEGFLVGGFPIEGNEDMFSSLDIGLEAGRYYDDDSYDEVILGNKIAEEGDYAIGDIIRLRSHDYEVVGIVNEMGTRDDYSIGMSLDAAQELIGKKDKVTLILVKPTFVEAAEDVAEEINDELGDEGIVAATNKDVQRSAAELTRQINIMTYSVGGVAAIIAAIVIMNVMFMSVRERQREIGTLKAIGATDWQILLEVMGESLVIGLIGGVVGTALSFIVVAAMNNYLEGSVVTITPRLIILSITFALLLGLMGGILPARRAAQLDPVKALRYE